MALRRQEHAPINRHQSISKKANKHEREHQPEAAFSAKLLQSCGPMIPLPNASAHPHHAMAGYLEAPPPRLLRQRPLPFDARLRLLLRHSPAVVGPCRSPTVVVSRRYPRRSPAVVKRRHPVAARQLVSSTAPTVAGAAVSCRVNMPLARHAPIHVDNYFWLTGTVVHAVY